MHPISDASGCRRPGDRQPAAPGPVKTFKPVLLTTQSQNGGNFEFDNLVAGTYTVCAESQATELLNTCFWGDKPVTASVPVGGSATGVSLAITKGVTLGIRINDPLSLLGKSGAVDDILIGTGHGSSPFLPATLITKDTAGKNHALQIPAGKPVDITFHSASFVLADQNGKPFSSPSFKITVNVPARGAASANGPDVVVQIAALGKGRP